jgi:hypothetical protein
MTAGSDAVWSRDGKRVAYRGTSSRFIVRAVDAPESSAIVLPTGNDAWLPTGWTLDGLGIFTAIYRSPRGLDIAVVPADGKGAPTFLVESAAQEQPLRCRRTGVGWPTSPTSQDATRFM